MRFLPRSSFWEHLLCVLAVPLLAAAVLYPAAAGGKLPIPSANLYALAPWQEAAPAGVETAATREEQAVTQRHYPAYRFLHNSLERGDSLFWNPYENCGTPFLAQWRTRVLSPFSLPFHFLEFNAAYILSSLLKLVVAGLTAFYAARRLGFLPPFALAVAAGFQLSAPLVLWNAWPLADTLAWLPLLVLFAERLAIGQGRYWPLGGLTLALMLLGGSPEAVAAACAGAALYLAARLAFARAPFVYWLRGFTPLAAALVLASGLVAVQLAPFLEFIRQATHSGGVQPETPPGLSALAALFYPHLLGHPPAGGEAAQANAFHTGLMHAGWLPVAMVPLWFALRGFTAPLQRVRVDALLIAAATLTLCGLVLAPLLRGAPVIGAVQAHHLLGLNGLAVAFMAAAAAEEWVHLNAAQCKAALKRMALGYPLLIAAGAGLAFWGAAASVLETPPLSGQAALAAGGLGVALALLAATLLLPSPRLLGYGLTGGTAVGLIMAFQPFLSFSDSEALYPETLFISTLRDTGERVSGNAALQRWPLAGNFVRQTFGAGNPVLRRHAVFAERLETDPLLVRRMGSPVLLLTREDIQGPFVSVRPLLQIREVFPSGAVLFTDLEGGSRARIVHAVRPAYLLNPADLSSSEPPVAEHSLPAQAPAAGPAGWAYIASPETNARVHVRVEGAQPGVLVLADAWYPGWRATVNGEPTPVFPVDALFRGVQVPEGNHDVVFHYAPQSFTTGLWISAAAGLVFLLGLINVWRRRAATNPG